MRKNFNPSTFILIILSIVFLFPQVAFGRIGILKKIKKISKLTVNLTVDPISNKVYVADFDSNKVVTIDGNTDRKVNEIKIAGSVAIDRVGFDPSTNKLYIVSQHSDSDVINILDGGTRQTLTTINVPNNPDRPFKDTPSIISSDLAINPTTNKTYFLTSGRGFGVFNEEANEISYLSLIPDNESPLDLKVNPGNNKVYICTHNKLLIIDSLTDTLSNTVAINDPSDNYAVTKIAIDPITNKVYVLITRFTGDNSPEEIKVIDGTTDEIIDSLFVKHATSLAIDPSSNILYVPLSFNLNGSGPFLSVIDLNSKKIFKKLSVKASPPFKGNATNEVFNIVVNPVAHKAYIQVDYVGIVVVGEK